MHACTHTQSLNHNQHTHMHTHTPIMSHFCALCDLLIKKSNAFVYLWVSYRGHLGIPPLPQNQTKFYFDTACTTHKHIEAFMY